MDGNISKRKGLLSEITNDDLNYISTQLEASLLKKQDKLIFDDKPTQGSENPVKSGGIKNGLDTKVDKKDGYGLVKESIYSTTGTGKGLTMYFEDGKSFGTIPDHNMMSDMLSAKPDKATTLSGYGITYDE